MDGKEPELPQKPKKTPYKISDIANQKFASKTVKNSAAKPEKSTGFSFIKG